MEQEKTESIGEFIARTVTPIKRYFEEENKK